MTVLPAAAVVAEAARRLGARAGRAGEVRRRRGGRLRGRPRRLPRAHRPGMIPGPYRNLALIGFMGAGKTSAAAALAERLGWRAVDADAEIEREAGQPIRDDLRRRRRAGVPGARGAGGDAAPARDRGRGRARRRGDHLAADPRAPARRLVHRAAGRLAADGLAADRGRGRRPPAGRRGARLRRALRAAPRRSTTPPPTPWSTPRRCTARRPCWRRSRGRARWPSSTA